MESAHADIRLELPVTFVGDDGRVIVNFGILTGREATQAEIDRLAQTLNDETGAGPDITIVSERRQDYGRGVETVTHQVTVETATDAQVEVEVACRAWVLACADDRRVEPLEL